MNRNRRKKMLAAAACLLLCISMLLCACQDVTDNEQLTTEAPTQAQSPTETDPSTETESSAETDPSTETESSAETDPSTETESSAETDPSTETEPPTETEPQKISYNILVMNASGALVGGVDLQISTSDSSLINVTTDSNGIASFYLDENDSVSACRIKIAQLPDGYTEDVSREYSFPTNTNSLIIHIADPEPEIRKITYTVNFKNESGTPLQGVYFQLFKGSFCVAPLASDHLGTATFELDETENILDYHIEITSFPSGYTGNATFFFSEIVETTLTVYLTEIPPTPAFPFVIENCGSSNGSIGRFNMAVRTDRSDYIDTEDLDGTIINDAVYERNMLIEELFNVEITMFEAGGSEATEYNANITNDVFGGVGAYDCTMGWNGSGLDNSGFFMNLLSFPELDFENDPWWLDAWHENSTFYDCMFTCNGDLQFEIYYNTEVVYFNKTMAQNLYVKAENNLPISTLVYQHVDNKTWTLDQLQTYGQIASSDADENGHHTKYEANYQNSEDVFGSLMNQSVAGPAMFALGAKYSTVTNGAIEFTFTNSCNYDAFDKLFAFMNETEYNYLSNTTTHGKESYEIFNDGHALFCWNTFSMAPQIKASGISYGILPLPMYEAGGDYITTAYHMSYFAFLTTTPNFHKAALVFNAMNALSTEILYDQYFGEYLEISVSDDPDSSRMIPLICNSLYFDYAWTSPSLSAGAANHFVSYLNDGNKNISAKMASYANMKNYVNEIKKICMNVRLGNSRS